MDAQANILESAAPTDDDVQTQAAIPATPEPDTPETPETRGPDAQAPRQLAQAETSLQADDPPRSQDLVRARPAQQAQPTPQAPQAPQAQQTPQTQGPPPEAPVGIPGKVPSGPWTSNVSPDQDERSWVHGSANRINEYASYYSKLAAMTGDPEVGAMARAVGAFAEGARALAGVYDNAIAAEQNGVPGAWSIAVAAMNGATQAAGFTRHDLTGLTAAAANVSTHAQMAAEAASRLLADRNEYRTAEGRSQAAWAAQGAAEAGQAMATAAYHALQTIPGNGIARSWTERAQENADMAAAAAAAAAVRLGGGTGGAES